jgi:hypothetical protein
VSFGDAGNALQEYMASGQKGDQEILENILFPNYET